VFQRTRKWPDNEEIMIAIVDAAVQIAPVGAKPAEHVFPGEKNGDGDTLFGGIFGVPAVDGDGVTGLLVIVRKDGRELLDGDVRGKFLPAVIKPGLRIKSVVITGA